MKTKPTVAFVCAIIFQVLAILWWLLPIYYFLLGPGSKPIRAPGGGGISEGLGELAIVASASLGSGVSLIFVAISLLAGVLRPNIDRGRQRVFLVRAFLLCACNSVLIFGLVAIMQLRGNFYGFPVFVSLFGIMFVLVGAFTLKGSNWSGIRCSGEEKGAGDEASAPARSEEQPLDKPMAALIGMLLGGPCAAVVGGLLAFVALKPPISNLARWEEFDGVLIFGIPMLASVCGAIAGLALGPFHCRHGGRLIASCLGALPGMLFYSLTYDSRSPNRTMTISLIMIVAAVAAVFLVSPMLAIIERRGARKKATARHAKSTGRTPIVLTVVITMIGLFCDYALWRTLSNMGNGTPGMLGIITFAVNAIALFANLIVIVIYRQHRLLRTACAILSLVGLSFAVFIWHAFVL